MKREVSFFDASISDAHPFGSEPNSNSPSEMGTSQHRDDLNLMARHIYSTVRLHQQQFARRTHEIGMIRQETESIHDPAVAGYQQPAPAFGSPAVTMEMYFGGVAAARLADDVPFISVCNGVDVFHSYPISSGEEHDLGTELTTTNFLGAMEQPLNPDYANQVLQPKSPELTIVTDPIMDLDPADIDWDLKL